MNGPSFSEISELQGTLDWTLDTVRHINADIKKLRTVPARFDHIFERYDSTIAQFTSRVQGIIDELMKDYYPNNGNNTNGRKNKTRRLRREVNL